MSLTNGIIGTGLLALTLALTACSSSSGPAPYKPLDLTGKSESYKAGAHDGCATADGDYTKNHDAFNNDIDYHEGWFDGRRNCEGRPR